jgi:hypothetical protein
MNRAERLSEETSDNVKKVIDKALEARERGIAKDMRTVENFISSASSQGEMWIDLDINIASVKPIVTKLESEGFYVTVSPKIAGGCPFSKPEESTIKISWKPKDIVKLMNDNAVKRWLRHHQYITAFNIFVGLFYSTCSVLLMAFAIGIISVILC